LKDPVAHIGDNSICIVLQGAASTAVSVRQERDHFHLPSCWLVENSTI